LLLTGSDEWTRGALHTFVCRSASKRAVLSAGRSGPSPAKTCQDGSILAARKAGMVRAEGIEPSRPCGLRIFIPLRLSPPRQVRVRGLDYTFTIPTRGLGAARLVSTPSRKCFRAWLGIAISGFPDFEQFYAVGFPMGTQLCLSPLRLPFRHARVANLSIKLRCRCEVPWRLPWPPSSCA
jgi:hypothetical protein